MTYKTIRYELTGDVATITFNSPDTLNAIGLDVVDELLPAFEQAGSESRATILTGSGRGFCSGANLGQSSAARSGSEKPDLGTGLDSHYHPLMRAMRNHPCPLITAVNGVAAGIGCSIALMGDMIIAADTAYFLQAFRRIGLVPDGGSTYLLPRLIGRVRAMEMILLGEKVTAAKALEWGMINDVVSEAALADAALALAEKLATGPTRALAMARTLVWDSADRDFETQLEAERAAQTIAGRTQDCAEGVTAFLQKRPANFTGS